MKTPEELVTDLRTRAAKGNNTFNKTELVRIAATLEMLLSRCAEAYQVVGSLAAAAGEFHDPAVKKALTLLSDPMRRGAILPFITANDRALAAAKPGKRATARTGTRARRKDSGQ